MQKESGPQAGAGQLAKGLAARARNKIRHGYRSSVVKLAIIPDYSIDQHSIQWRPVPSVPAFRHAALFQQDVPGHHHHDLRLTRWHWRTRRRYSVLGCNLRERTTQSNWLVQRVCVTQISCSVGKRKVCAWLSKAALSAGSNCLSRAKIHRYSRSGPTTMDQRYSGSKATTW